MIPPAVFARAGAVVAAALLLLACGFVALAPTAGSWLALGLGLAVAPLAVALGVVVASRPGAPRVGALLTFFGLTVAAVIARETWTFVLATNPEAAAAFAWLVALTSEGAIWILASAALLLLHFPDGGSPGHRWRALPPAMVASAALVQLAGAFDTIPFRPPLEDLARPFDPAPDWLALAGLLAFVIMLVCVVASAGSLVGRFRRADRARRSQVKWLAVGGFGLALYPLVCGVEILVGGAPGWASAAVGVAGLVGMPVAVAIAVLRHDLYDVDRAFAATFAWAAVSVVLIGLFVTTSFTVGVVLGQGSPGAAAAAAALCAFALTPLHARVGRIVDRRLYPRRRAAFDAVDRLQDAVGRGEAQPETLQAVLRTALRDEGLMVGYRPPAGDGFVDLDGNPVPVAAGHIVRLEATPIGVVVPQAGDTAPGLLREIAARATALVEIVRLRLELAGALREVEASRARLVLIGYEERRRLERDLHDGAQQRLVSLGLAIRLAQRHLGDGTVDIARLLDDSVDQLSSAVAELRQLAQGIRPSSLDDGLEAALARLVQNLPIEIDADVVAGPLPDDVATTAYFVVSEAVANAVKHADARHIGLRVAREDARVIVRVSDDGRGGASLRPGSGLADRVAALGGSLSISSPAGRGTVVEAALPCAS